MSQFATSRALIGTSCPLLRQLNEEQRPRSARND